MMIFKLFFLFIFVVLLFNCHVNYYPDLIINNIISNKIGSSYVFDITIENIGESSLNDMFYLCNSKTKESYDTYKFYQSMSVNHTHEIIDIGSTITVTMAINEDTAHNIIRFVLFTNKTYFETYLKPGSAPDVFIIESDYSNNFSEIVIY